MQAFPPPPPQVRPQGTLVLQLLRACRVDYWASCPSVSIQELPCENTATPSRGGKCLNTWHSALCRLRLRHPQWRPPPSNNQSSPPGYASSLVIFMSVLLYLPTIDSQGVPA